MTSLEIKQIEATIANLNANTAKLQQETMKMQKETLWYPLAVSSGLILVIGAIVKYLV
jgi:hypothetical protein